MSRAVKVVVFLLVLAAILGCKKKGAFEKMGQGMDKAASDMNKALQDLGNK